MQHTLRPARANDIDALIEIENAVFEADRISRRSFRQLIERKTARTIVAEAAGAVVGYAMVLFRAASGVARLYSIAVKPDAVGGGVGRSLLSAAERAAYDQDRLVMRLEAREDNVRAVEIYQRAGYRRIGREPAYYGDGMAALRMEKTLRGDAPVSTTVPYYEQSCDFTCGPACLMMAKAYFDPTYVPDPIKEIRLWREATTVFMMSGPGGCEPYGLAVAAHELGMRPKIIVSPGQDTLFVKSVRMEEKRRVMELAQADFRARAATLAIPVKRRGFALKDIRAALQAGRLVLVLVSGYLMFGKKVPHWVLAIADAGDHIMIHDPWLEEERGETIADAANIPVPYDLFMRMAQFGREGLRAAIELGRRESK